MQQCVGAERQTCDAPHVFCMYLLTVQVSPRITGTEPWNCAVAGEHLVSVLASFVSNCKLHWTVQIQLVKAAHDKYTLRRVQVYGS